MFCSNCNHQLKDGESFCPNCGQKTGAAEKFHWQDYMVAENFERLAPLAALMPLAMFTVLGIVGTLLSVVLFLVGLGFFVPLLQFLFKIVFIVSTVSATVGLTYIVLNHKDTSNINAWIVPAVTLLASISCISGAFGWMGIAKLFGIISIICGLEFLARIVIGNAPIDSPMDPAAAYQTYRRYYHQYREKYLKMKQESVVMHDEASVFDGTGAELLGYYIVFFVITVISCGFATPWMLCMLSRWKTQHTVINGKRLVFTGSGASLLGHWILWEVLTIITCGIYGLFVHVAYRKWVLRHTFIEGELIMCDGSESNFDGDSFAFIGYSLLSWLVITLTLGLAYPWVMSFLQEWDTKHQLINGRRLQFNGSGLGFLGEFIVIFILTMVTCGLYAPWGRVRLHRYIVEHTYFVD